MAVGAVKMTGLLTFLDPPREDTAHREDNTAHREDNILDDTDAVRTAADIVLTRLAKHTIGLVIDSQATHIAGSHILRSLAERVEPDPSAEV